jgi:hypothetical protein
MIVGRGEERERRARDARVSAASHVALERATRGPSYFFYGP